MDPSMPMGDGGSAPEHSHGSSLMAGHGIYFCDGEPLLTEGGSWIGHLLPGVAFLLWGVHWMQGSYVNYFNSRRVKGADYRAQTTHTLWRFPAISESILKTLLPIVAFSLELYFAHRGGYRSMICAAGSPRAGHIYGPHVGNWQHAAMYPMFFIAGLIDLAGFEIELPAGTQQVALFMCFLNESLLMGLHKKHTPLDIAVHSILFYTMVATAASLLVELLYPTSFMASCFRVWATLTQAVWFFAAAHIMFGNSPFWDEEGGADMAPMMMAAVWLVFCICAVVAFMFIAFLCFHAFYAVRDARSGGAPYERASEEEERPAVRAYGGDKCAAVPSPASGTSCQV